MITLLVLFELKCYLIYKGSFTKIILHIPGGVDLICLNDFIHIEYCTAFKTRLDMYFLCHVQMEIRSLKY